MDRNLITFVVLAETGNMTAAAERLNITQPTLTKRLQQLELHYHCKLFERLPRGVNLTPLGEVLLPFARSIKETYLQADEALDAVQSDHLEEIRVGAGPLFHLRYLGKAFETLREEFPNTRIRLTADLNSRNLPSLRSGSKGSRRARTAAARRASRRSPRSSHHPGGSRRRPASAQRTRARTSRRRRWANCCRR